MLQVQLLERCVLDAAATTPASSPSRLKDYRPRAPDAPLATQARHPSDIIPSPTVVGKWFSDIIAAAANGGVAGVDGDATVFASTVASAHSTDDHADPAAFMRFPSFIGEEDLIGPRNQFTRTFSGKRGTRPSNQDVSCLRLWVCGC